MHAYSGHFSRVQLCDPIDYSPLLCPWDSPGKILEWVAMTSCRASSLCFLHCRGFFTTEPPRKTPFGDHLDFGGKLLSSLYKFLS